MSLYEKQISFDGVGNFTREKFAKLSQILSQVQVQGVHMFTVRFNN